MTSSRAPRAAWETAACDINVLDFRARVIAPPALLRELRASFPEPPAWSTPAAPLATTTFQLQIDTPHPGWYELAREGLPLWASGQRDEVLPYLDWAINTAAVERLGQRYLLLHAGAVARGGQGLVLPAASGSGKTTLTAALLKVGFRYLSDEVAAVEPASRRLVPFAKSLRVKQGGRRVLTPRYPDLTSSVPRRRLNGESVWYLLPPANAWPSEPMPVRYVVLPEYMPRARTTLVPLSRSAALARLLPQSFSVCTLGAGGSDALVEMLRTADCYALAAGDLDQALDLLLQLTAT